MDAVLQARDLYAGYRGVPVVRAFNLKLRAGQIIGLLGPNGAGKTTAMLTLAGSLKPVAGATLIDGEPVRTPLSARARRGLALVTDDRGIFRSLTVRENLRLGAGPVPEALAFFPALEALLDRKAGLLSGGEQQMLALARVLARRPRILLADEISLGLAPIIVTQLMTALRRAADSGSAVLLVEQQVRLVLGFCDHAIVLKKGETVLQGSPQSLRSDPELLESAYLGVPLEQTAPSSSASATTSAAVAHREDTSVPES